MSARVTVVTTRVCGYCNAAKRLLERLGISYEERDVTQDPEARARIVSETGWRTVPVIFIDGQVIGGYRELEAMHSAGQLAEVLATGQDPQS